MKIRTNFVSNSSSTSFIIDADKFSVEKIRTIVKKMLEVFEIMEGKELFVDDFCEIYEVDNCDNFCNKINEYSKPYDIAENFDYKCEEESWIKERLGSRKCIIVDSTGDNSIPWTIQTLLETISVHRMHWG